MKTENASHKITILNFTTESGAFYQSINLSFQVFGPEINTAPIVLVNHALTGNSQVIGENGWWNDIIGENKIIDTHKYTVIAFNVPGNGFDGEIIENYLDFNARDIAKIFLEGLEVLEIKQLYAIIGGSVGGGIAWEMVGLNLKITQHLIPVASDWKATDWLVANCFLQEQILKNSSKPIEDARIHAMLCYRSPESFKEKFQRTKVENSDLFNIESWMNHHGDKLQKRFQLASYKLMNQLLKTIDITRNRTSFEEMATQIQANVHMIAIDSDLFFGANENKETFKTLKKNKVKVSYNEIKSIHGHDAFLIEFEQLENILKEIF